MNIATYDDQEHTIISLEGKCDIYTVDSLKETLGRVIDSHPSSIVIDMTHVISIDSSVIGVLYMGKRKMTALGGRFYLKKPSQRIRDVIAITKINFETINLD